MTYYVLLIIFYYNLSSVTVPPKCLLWTHEQVSQKPTAQSSLNSTDCDHSLELQPAGGDAMHLNVTYSATWRIVNDVLRPNLNTFLKSTNHHIPTKANLHLSRMGWVLPIQIRISFVLYRSSYYFSLTSSPCLGLRQTWTRSKNKEGYSKLSEMRIWQQVLVGKYLSR